MATFYIEAVEATDIALVKVGSPTIGIVKYGVNDATCPNTYTVTTSSTPISLTAGQKCYWTITSTTAAFSTSMYLQFTSTAKINVGGNLSDLIGGETAIPRDYCFYRLFHQCVKLVDASNLVVVNDFNSKTRCYGDMFFNCTSLTTAPELPATTLANYCYSNMFRGCTSLKLSATQTEKYTIPYRIPKEGTGTTASNALSNMFTNTGGTFTGTPEINTTYYTIKTQANVQLYDGDVKLYPITKYENLIGDKPTYTASEIGAVAIAQGAAESGKFLVVGADGNVTTGEGGGDIFIATYGTTTGQEIYDAYHAGKIIIAKKSDHYALLASIAGTMAHFYRPNYGVYYDSADWDIEYPTVERWVCQNENWSTSTYKNAPQHSSSHHSDGSDPITPSDIGAIEASARGAANGVASLGSDGKLPTSQLPSMSSTEVYSKTLTTAGWIMGTDGRYYQDVSVTGVTPTTKVIIVDVDLTTNDTDAKVEYLTAWQGPSANEAVQGSGKLTFYSYEKPTVAIPIFVGVSS